MACSSRRADLGVVAHGAAVDLRGDAPGVRRVAVPARREHLGEHLRAGRDHQRPGAGGHEHHAPHPAAGLERELLGERAAPRQAEHVELPVPEPGDQRGHPGGQRGHGVGERGSRRPAHPGYVEPDHAPVRVEGVDQWLQRLEARADPVAQQQRRRVGEPAPAGADADAHLDAAHRDGAQPVAAHGAEPGLSDRGHRCPVRRRPARRRRSPADGACCAPAPCARRASRRSRPTSCP